MLIEENLSEEAKQAVAAICSTAQRYLDSRKPDPTWNCSNCSHFYPNERLWLCDSVARWNKEKQIRSNINSLTVCEAEEVDCKYWRFKGG